MYGDHIKDHKNLLKIKADLRNLGEYKNYLKDIDVVIHLACISNDPSFELNPKLGKSINFDCFEPLVEEALKEKLKSLYMHHPLRLKKKRML